MIPSSFIEPDFRKPSAAIVTMRDDQDLLLRICRYACCQFALYACLERGRYRIDFLRDGVQFHTCRRCVCSVWTRFEVRIPAASRCLCARMTNPRVLWSEFRSSLLSSDPQSTCAFDGPICFSESPAKPPTCPRSDARSRRHLNARGRETDLVAWRAREVVAATAFRR